MLLLREVPTPQAGSLTLWGETHDLQRLADQLSRVGNAHLADLVRQAVSLAKVVAGRPMGSVSFQVGQSGAPHALIEAAHGAGVALEYRTDEHQREPEGPRAPQG